MSSCQRTQQLFATVALVSVSVLISVAQPVLAGGFVDEPITYQWNIDGKETKLSIPFVESKDRRVDERINAYLHLSILGIVPPADGHPSGASAPSDEVRNLSLLESRGVRSTNQGRVLSVSYVAKPSGSGFEFTKDVDFDAKTGRLILIDDVLTAKGRKAVGERVTAERVWRIRHEVRRLKEIISTRTTTAHGDTPEIAAAKIDLYQACLRDELSNRHSQDQRAVLGNMTIRDRALVFSRGPCSNQSIDDLGDLENRMGISDVKDDLTEYGKTLFFGGTALPQFDPFAQVLTGYIGRDIRVTVWFGAPARWRLHWSSPWHGKYYYDKYRQPIDLLLVKKGNVFEATETGADETTNSVLTLRTTGNKLSGQWQGKGKQYQMEVAP